MYLYSTSGENAIVIVSGANLTLGPADVAAAESLFSKAAVVVCQLEVPPETSLAALIAGKKHGGMCPVIVHLCACVSVLWSRAPLWP